jgi:hypothetical protein
MDQVNSDIAIISQRKVRNNYLFQVDLIKLSRHHHCRDYGRFLLCQF